MPTQDLILLLFIISVFAAFGITLAFASWDETRTRNARSNSPAPRTPAPRMSAPRIDQAQGVPAR